MIINSTDNETEDDYWTPIIINVIRQTNFVLYAVIVFVGLVGNAFSVLVIWKTNLRKISSNHYLVALACSDSVFLIGLFMMWLSKFKAPTYHYEGACQTVLFLLNCSSWLSSWYITALTLERCYVVHRPLSKRTVCTIGRTRATVILLIPWPVMFNVWVIFGSGVNDQGQCNTNDDFYHIGLILNCFDTIVTFVMPLFIVVACNVAICLKLCKTDEFLFNKDSKTSDKKSSNNTIISVNDKSDKKLYRHNVINIHNKNSTNDTDKNDKKFSVINDRTDKKSSVINANDKKSSVIDDKRLLSVKKQCPVQITVSLAGAGSSESRKTPCVSRQQRQERKITISLLIISFVFVAMNTPTYVMRLALYFSAVTDTAYDLSLTGTVFQNVFFIMYYANFSINFFVYSLSSDNFRKSVKILWFSKFCKMFQYESLSRTVTLANSRSPSSMSGIRKTTREESSAKL